MIRVCLFGNRAYSYDVTGWDEEISGSEFYVYRLGEALLEKIAQGDVLMLFDSNESAEDWCKEHGFEYELVKENDNN